MSTSFYCAILGLFYLTFIINHEVTALVTCEEVSSSSAAILLTCSNNQMIHVISEKYGDKGQGETCLDTDNCTKSFTNDGDSLAVSCNGKQNCYEACKTVASDCDPKYLTFEIEYDCIEGSIDICSPVTKSMDGSVYIHSPGFPDSVGVNSSCHCNITGSGMLVILFEHRLKQGVVTLSTDNRATWSSNFVHYNRVIASRTRSVFLNYDNYNMSYVNVWIRVIGVGTISVTCWRGNTGVVVTQPTSTSSSRYPTSSQQHTTDSEATKSEGNIRKQQDYKIIDSLDVTKLDEKDNSTFNVDREGSFNIKVKESGVTSSSATDAQTSSIDHTTSVSSTGSGVSSVPSTDTQTSSTDHTTSVSSTEKVGSDTSNSDSNTVTLVAAICGAIILVLLIVISLLVYLKVIKPTRNQPSNKENTNITEIPNKLYAPYEDVTDSNTYTELQGSGDASNTYNDLSQYENTDGLHEYGKIHAYSNTE